MSNPSSNFMPTTKAQSVLVYALNLMLLFNLSVIVVMLSYSGPSPSNAQATTSEIGSAELDEPQRRVTTFAPASEPVAPADTEPFEPEVSAEPEPITRVTAQPMVLEDMPADEPENRPIAAVEPKADKQQEEPVRFFGVGLD